MAGRNTNRTSFSEGFSDMMVPISDAEWRRAPGGAHRSGLDAAPCFVSSTFQRVDRERRGVSLRVLRIEALAVEQRFRFVTASAVGVTELLHGLLVDVRAHHLFRDRVVVGL